MTLASDSELVPDMCAEKQRGAGTAATMSATPWASSSWRISKAWQADLQKKRDIVLRGKNGPGEGRTRRRGRSPKQDDTQPVFFHQLPQEYYLEVIQS